MDRVFHQRHKCSLWQYSILVHVVCPRCFSRGLWLKSSAIEMGYPWALYKAFQASWQGRHFKRLPHPIAVCKTFWSMLILPIRKLHDLHHAERNQAWTSGLTNFAIRFPRTVCTFICSQHHWKTIAFASAGLACLIEQRSPILASQDSHPTCFVAFPVDAPPRSSVEFVSHPET